MSQARDRESLLLPVLLPVGIVAVIVLVLFLFSRILLAVSHTAATVVALVVLLAVLGVASFVASRRQVGGSALFSMVAWITGVAMVAGGVAVVAAPLAEGEGSGESQAVTLAAPPGAAVDGYSTDALSVDSDVPIDLEFDNAEPGVQHNVVITDGDDAQAPVLFQGQLLTGPDVFTYSVNALPEGEFFFFCEVHPTTMVGTVASAPGQAGGEGGGGGEGEGGGGAGSVAIAAQGTAFDTATLQLPAETEVTLTFDNQDDAAVTGPHNVAIFDGDTALFQGELVDGPATVDYTVPGLPAGTYEFRCETHPEMSGSVEVA